MFLILQKLSLTNDLKVSVPVKIFTKGIKFKKKIHLYVCFKDNT